ncbi:sodium/proline symporter PutP [Shimwellia blattae]|uniref:Sodium/proline symporter n=1 Tax=Shimwellia blattae (strain ATCC 29907 / DSM 4481 / JCM 1650 / NBRC 105725 / CDC 9005-74) TaxID=630626 RepID=I2BCF3_SHIBC|nr:sodium/proline symporter PutP [Shimwellia blattae]AFJ48207.1 sodium/proline symporter [Shimwellia blattae DSM 4481 = NBRC 105725]GAB82766.1 sodium/proline symporter [Shimwellia blattae DSM 4481 = NBRC 105725]VDY65703.1 Propionate transporter [Shimwellia blattae]VEC25439.1 Propionate transporter [Shimwellia blattae]
MFYLHGAFLLYLVGMLLVGLYFYRRTRNTADYILGSRNLPPAVAALSAGASDLSGWALMGLPGAIYIGGLSNLWIVLFTLAGVYINWRFIAPRLRALTETLGDAQTIPEYLHNRFTDNNNQLRLVSSLVILVFFTFYVAAGLSGGAILFESTFNIDFNTALLTGGLVIVSYTFLGGYLAVCWTDFFQGLMMALSLAVVALTLLFWISGGGNDAPESLAFQFADLRPDMGWFWGILSLSGWCIGYLGQPHVLVRFMSVRNQRDIGVSRRIAVLWTAITMCSAVLVGWLGRSYFPAPLANGETVFIALSQAIFHPFVAGLIIAGVLASIMSTIDSQLLVCSSTLSEDFYRAYVRRGASDREVLLVARLAVLAVALVGFLLARHKADTTLLNMVAYAWGGFGAAFGPVILFSLFWRSMTRLGAILGLISGALVALIWNQNHGGIFDLFGVVPGFLAASLAIVLAGKARAGDASPATKSG